MVGMGQSAEFGKFLKAMRSRLSPEDAGGLGTSGARRVPGLRREEVAMLAGVSTDYYIRLEQGRNIHPSRAVLEAVSRALRLDSSEHAHMMDLLENCAASGRAPEAAQRIRPALRNLLDAVGDVPALILGRRSDVLAGNRLAFLLFSVTGRPWLSRLPARSGLTWAGTPMIPRRTSWWGNWPCTASTSANGGQGTGSRHPPRASCGSIMPPSAIWN